MLGSCCGALNSSSLLSTVCCSALHLLSFQTTVRRSSDISNTGFSALETLHNTRALHTGAASSSDSAAVASTQDAVVAQLRAADDQHRRGFGGKVSLPAEDVLKQVVVAAAEGPVDLTLRSYHVGSRVHIGRVLAHVRFTHPECRTTAGKDYALIWLDDLAPAAADPGPFGGISLSQFLPWLSVASASLEQILPRSRQIKPPVVSLQKAKEQLQQQEQQQRHEVVTVTLSTATVRSSIKPASTLPAPVAVSGSNVLETDHAPAAVLQTVQGQGSPQQQQQQQQQQMHGAFDDGGQQQSPRQQIIAAREQQLGAPTVLQVASLAEQLVNIDNYHQHPQQLKQQLKQQLQQLQQQQGQSRLGPPTKPLQPPFMAVYRSGSVVFGGLGEKEELVWLGHFVPPAVRYTGEDVSQWLRGTTSRGRAVPSIASKEVQRVVVDSRCPAYAEQGDDEVRLRVLDVGGVRVLTSVLAQSAALKFYEESVSQSLERLALWRAQHSGARAARTSGGQPLSFLFKIIWGNKQDKAMFKVFAASALIINEAQQLLEMAEPAWQYNTYNMIWELMAKDQQLESRIKALGMKLHQVEAEAKHDVKARAGRRMLLLNQGIILLLAISCLLAALDNALKISGLPAADSSSSAVGSDLADAAGSSSSGGGGHDTGWTVDADGSRQCAYPESVSDETSVQLG